MRSLLSAAIIFVFSAAGVVAQNSGEREPARIAGRWELTLESPHGAIQFALHVRQEGSKISGTAERDGKAHTLTGSVQQNQISFSFEPRQDATLAFKGAVDGDKMTGSAEPKGGQRQHEGEGFVLSWKATRRQ